MTQVQARIEAARLALEPRPTKPGALGLLGATALAAATAVLLAGVMVLGPGIALRDTPVEGASTQVVG